MYREWRNPWPSGYRCYRSRLLRKGNKLNIVLRNCKIVVEMKLEISEYHDSNWFLGSRKVYEPLVTISGGKIYQTFLQVGSWTWLEISTMAHDYEISPSIFKNEEKTLYIHYMSWSSPSVLLTNDPQLEQSCLRGKQRYFRKIQVAKLVTIMSKTKWTSPAIRSFKC